MFIEMSLFTLVALIIGGAFSGAATLLVVGAVLAGNRSDTPRVHAPRVPGTMQPVVPHSER